MTQKWIIVPWEKWQSLSNNLTMDKTINSSDVLSSTKNEEIEITPKEQRSEEYIVNTPIENEKAEYKWLSWR